MGSFQYYLILINCKLLYTDLTTIIILCLIIFRLITYIFLRYMKINDEMIYTMY